MELIERFTCIEELTIGDEKNYIENNNTETCIGQFLQEKLGLKKLKLSIINHYREIVRIYSKETSKLIISGILENLSPVSSLEKLEICNFIIKSKDI